MADTTVQRIASSEDRPRIPGRPAAQAATTALVCLLLAATNYLVGLNAALSKSPTSDEPYHWLAGYVQTFYGDYRADPEDPPLWRRLAILPVRGDALKLDFSHPAWDATLADEREFWAWMDHVLFHTPGNNVIPLINRSRCLMAGMGAIVVLASCAIAWRLAGRAAAIAAGVLVALDPLILGHAPLVKNDVLITLLALLLAGMLLAVMLRATASRLLALMLLGGLAMGTKFSAIGLLGLAGLTLFVRAMIGRPWDWPVVRRTLATPASQLLAVSITSLIAAAIAWVIVWASYDFRYAPTPDGRQTFDASRFSYQFSGRNFVAREQRQPTTRERDTFQPGLLQRAMLFADSRRLLPDAFCMGVLSMYSSAELRQGYLLGERRQTGWWYYFPLAMLFKTPTASLVAVIGSIGVLMFGAVAGSRARGAIFCEMPSTAESQRLRCALVVLTVFGGGYLLLAMRSNLNIGVRHVLPLYPLLYIAAGVVFARLLAGATSTRMRRIIVSAAAVMGMGLIVEVGSAWPNYIAFFNVAAGGERGGIRLLGDSNLDWGQDLPALAAWQARHPNERLYACLFGSTDPAAYGVRCTMLPGASIPGESLPGASFPEPPEAPSEPGVLAISATSLQGLYLPPKIAAMYMRLRSRPPRAVLGGGTIYLFDFPIRGAAATSPASHD